MEGGYASDFTEEIYQVPCSLSDTAQSSPHPLQSKRNLAPLPLPSFLSYLYLGRQVCLAGDFLPSACPSLGPLQMLLSADVSQWAFLDFYFSVQHKHLYSLHKHPKHN